MKRLLFICGLVFLASAAQAQTPVALTAIPRPTFTQNGAPLVNGCLFSFAAGTSTPLATYTDSTGSVQNANPILLDSNGTANSGGNEVGIYLSAAAYKFQLKSAGGSNCSSGSTVWTADNISAAAFLNLPNTWTALQTFSAGIVTTTLNATGTATFKSLNGGVIVFADQFAGSDASAKIQAAIVSLPAAGGTVDARALSDAGGTGSTIIDPGAKSVTLLLGPYPYQIQQLVLETNFHVIGTGDGSYGASSTSTTVLQACATCAAINTVVLGTNGGNGGPVQHALMEGLRIYGATADTAIGMNLKTVNGSGTGIWYSTFRNMCVGACGPSGASANGFTGGAIILDATGANTTNQFLDFTNVSAVKTNGGSPALSLLGTNGQISFTQCPFDGTTRNDGTTVVQIANSSGNQGPYSIKFDNATVQHGTTGINIAGALGPILLIGTHFELVGQAITVNSGVGGDISGGVLVQGSTCQNFCGNNSGSGWFAKTTTPNAVSVEFLKNELQSTVDATYVGFTNVTGMGDESDTATATTLLPALIPRVTYKGTQLTTGAFSFGAGWGTSPSFTSVRGTDGSFILTLSSGTGSPAANPTITLTFADGTWTTAPNCVPLRQDINAPTTAYWVESNATTATVLTLAFVGTPAVSTSYTVGVACSGLPN